MSQSNDKSIKVLFLSQRFLFPQDTGGKIRTSKILEKLNKKFSVTVISNVESPQDDPYLPNMTNLCDKFIPVPWVEVKKYSLKFWWRLFYRSFSKYPITMHNDYSPELEEAVLDELSSGDYDLAVCDFMQSTLNFKQVTGIPVLLFQHNVEAAIAKRHYDRSKDPVSRLFWWLQYKKMFYHERVMCNRFDRVIAVSENDREQMQKNYGAKNVYTIPTGVDTDFFKPMENITEKKQIVFVGAMDWLPNEDAMIYFVEKIYPLIKNRISDVHLKIVGRNPSPKFSSFIENTKNVEVTGWVDDIRPYVAESAVFIVPIRIGGGTRMKIYQAMGMAKAVVSTSVGAEGLPLKHGKHILFADGEEEFADNVVSLLNDPKTRMELGNAAREYVCEYFGWENVAGVFADICYGMLPSKNAKKQIAEDTVAR